MKGEVTTRVMVDLIKVTKFFPPDVTALIDISVSIQRGEMFFLVGASGAGKTTLLKLICNVEEPSKGLVEVAGEDLSKLKPRQIQKLRQRIGVAYQGFKLLPERTVAQNIAIAMEVAYKRKAVIVNRIRDLLLRLDLEDKHDTRVRDLSRGEQQRVGIARSVANNPELILADEPTGNLDGETTGRVMELYRQCNQSGATVIIATHDESIYTHTTHRVMELRGGRKISLTTASTTP